TSNRSVGEWGTVFGDPVVAPTPIGLAPRSAFGDFRQDGGSPVRNSRLRGNSWASKRPQISECPRIFRRDEWRPGRGRVRGGGASLQRTRLSARDSLICREFTGNFLQKWLCRPDR